MRGDSCRPTRSNSAKFASVAPWVSVACSVMSRSVWLPRMPSSTYGFSGEVAAITLVSKVEC
jgi:hypothetical protein